MWRGTGAMVQNDGTRSNEAAFWKVFAACCGDRVLKDRPLFDDFYARDFQQAQASCGFAPDAGRVVRLLRDAGCRAALATNPIFPAVATESRIRWAGLKPEDFELYTTYENIGWCKPNLDYYREILRRMRLAPQDCLMVGNDVGEDMVAEQLGLRVFLLTDCLINKENADISAWPHGGFDALTAYLQKALAEA